MIRLLAALLALAVSAPFLAAAVGDDAPLVITSESAGAERRFEAFDTTKLTLADLDGDGDLEAVAHNDNNRVYVLDPTDGRVLAELDTNHPGEWKVRELNDVAVGDVDGDGRQDLVVANSASWLTVFEVDPLNATADGLAFRKTWEVKVDPRAYEDDYMANHPWLEGSGGPSMDGGAYLADVDDDGTLETFVQTDGWPGHFAFNADGSLRWMTSWSDGNSNPWVDDLDGDGRYEAVFGTDGGRLFVYDADKGYLKWIFKAFEHGADPGSISVSPAVADLDGDGLKEIVFGVRHAVEDPADPEWYLKQNARFYAVSPPTTSSGSATLLWNVTFPWLNPHTYTHPAVLDVDDDGDLDVLTMDWNTVGHKPGDWEQTGPPNLFALDGATGELLWKTELESYWNNKDLVVVDVDGDGSQEIVTSDPRWGKSGIAFRDLATGAWEGHVRTPEGWGTIRGPVAGDVDGDGTYEILQPLHRDATDCPVDRDVGCREGAILVLRTSGTEAAWDGAFTFNAETEHVYPDADDPRDAPRVAVGWGPPEEGRLVLDVRSNVHVQDVEVTDGATTVDLDPSDDGLWRGDGAFAAGTALEVRVEHAAGSTVTSLVAPSPPPATTPPPTDDPVAPPDDDATSATPPVEDATVDAPPREAPPDEAAPPEDDPVVPERPAPGLVVVGAVATLAVGLGAWAVARWLRPSARRPPT